MNEKTEVGIVLWLDEQLVGRIDQFEVDLEVDSRPATLAVLLEAAMNAIDEGNWHYESGKLHFTK